MASLLATVPNGLMPVMRLASFISRNKESILMEWEAFARTIEPAAVTMDAEGLRDHAAQILDIIVADLDAPQTRVEQSEKSRGRGPEKAGKTYAEIHADTRLESGYTITQLVSEYRALRASVLRLWSDASKKTMVTDPEDITRFNEAIDQALAESVSRFADLTAERAEAARLRLDAVLQAAPVGIMLADERGRLRSANPENRRIWGDHPDVESGDDYRNWKGWWADGSEKHGQALQPHEWVQVPALAGEDSLQGIIEIEPFGSPGERRTVLLHRTPVRDAINKVVGSVVAQMDITSLVKTEAALRDSEAKFRTIAEAMPQMVWSTLPNGDHDYYNQQWYDFTGVATGSTDGEGWNRMFHPDDRARAWEVWRHSLATGEPYEIHYRLRHRSGDYRWTLGRALPVRDESGKITRWMGTCTDIHDQKHAEEKLKDADLRKDEFLAMLAHELRNPLAPISSAAGILRHSKLDESLIKKTSEVISRQVRHMTSLVDDLLDVSRVTRGLIELENTPLHMHRIVADAVEQVNPLIHARRHQLTLHLAPETTIVVGDSKRLVQVIANLLTNAAKYTEEGGNILLETEVEAGSVSLTVQDDGIGMAPEMVERVFDLFTQAERTSDRSSGGLGMGLALVKSLVELHGGKVTCASKGHGFGSRFTVSLPRQPEAEDRVHAPHRPGDEIQAGEELKILVVDDNVDAAEMLSVLLTAAGHDVFTEHRSRSALDRATVERPDVCLLDIGMPEMDGNELAQCLRSRPETATAVLVAVTGYGQEHDRQKAFAAGFDHHLVKPVDPAKLTELLATVRAPWFGAVDSWRRTKGAEVIGSPGPSGAREA